jgi:hypothetical protein
MFGQSFQRQIAGVTLSLSGSMPGAEEIRLLIRVRVLRFAVVGY